MASSGGAWFFSTGKTLSLGFRVFSLSLDLQTLRSSCKTLIRWLSRLTAQSLLENQLPSESLKLNLGAGCDLLSRVVTGMIPPHTKESYPKP